MPATIAIGCAQITATPDQEHNLAEAERLVREAAAANLDLVALPEAFDFLAPGKQAIPAYAPLFETHPVLKRMEALAGELSIAILAGSVSARLADGRIVNRSVMIDAGGHMAGYYDKIHLFDVDLPDEEAIRESDLYSAGGEIVTLLAAGTSFGLSICYDMRFPHLYRALARAGARVITVPAAFSSFTGPLHWHALLRARAIETGCFVVAPAQCGPNHEGRISYGHSLIIDPWGRVLAEAGDKPGLISAEIDLDEVDRFRAAIPSVFLERVPANLEATS